MERVAFILTHSDERISCMLNPQSLVLRRWAGIKPRSSIGGSFVSNELSDTPLLHTGGGVTELTLDLLFDISVSGSTITTEDVRDLTAPFWEMAENMVDSNGKQYPPQVRFVWGKSWNIPGVVIKVAEKFDRFTRGGSPTRSWMRLSLLRVLEIDTQTRPVQFLHSNVLIPEKRKDASVNELTEHVVSSQDRLDILALKYYGDVSFWRLLASYNGISDPLHIEESLVLKILPKGKLEKSE
jgi:hypothetical protein